MKNLPKGAVDRIRENYPTGCRVVLTRMDDPQAPPIGTEGTVIAVDDIGTIHVKWDNGSGLGVAYGEDACRKKESKPDLGERIEALGEAWYIKEVCGQDGNLKAVELYNSSGDLLTEQPDRETITDWFIDNIINAR